MAGGRPERNYLDREGYCIRVVTGDDASAIYEATREFIEAHEDGEAVVSELLVVEEERGTWTFEDISMDSGTFGEVVSAGIVEKVDGEYRVGNVEGVRVALEGEGGVSETTQSESVDWDFSVDYRALGGVGAALFVVVLARVIQYRSVFVGEHVVSPGNDQYRYRYWMDRLLADSSGPLDFGVVAGAPWGDYAQSWNERPLSHASYWFLAELLGGDQWAAELVVAWFPVLSAVLVSLMVYKIALVLTDDVRIGIASILVVALAPVHVVYTQVGWSGNRPHQYLWFGLTILTLVWLATDVKHRQEVAGKAGLYSHLQAPQTWVAVSGLGIGLAFWTHSWAGSAMFFFPLIGYIGVRVLMDIREGVSPVLANLSVTVGIGSGMLVAVGLHLAWDWHGLLAIGMIVIAFVATVALVGLGELWWRLGRTPTELVGFQIALGGVGLLLLVLFSPEFTTLGRDVYGSALSFGGQSTQSQSLYSLDQFVFFGPVAQVGVTFYIAVVALVWCLWSVSRRYEPAWLVIAVFTGYYFVVSGFMTRFAAPLTIVMAVLAGTGIVYFLSVLGLARRPQLFTESDEQKPTAFTEESARRLSIILPSTWTARSYVLAIGLLVFGVSLVFVPSLTAQTAHDEAHLDAALAIEEHVEMTDREYPENHVFASWGEYRLYNYFVSGEAHSESLGRYGYTHIYSWTETGELFEYLDGQAGYVVVDLSTSSPDESVHRLLATNSESSLEGTDSEKQLRPIHTSDDGRIVVFAIVSGDDS